MPAKNLLVPNKVRKQAKKLPGKVKTRLAEGIMQIKANPLAGEKLQGELASFYKLRVGDYRIVYRFDTKESLVFVVKIEHRQGVYK